MIGQSGEHVCEPSLRVDVVELGGLDESVDGGGAMAAFVRSCEVPIHKIPKIYASRFTACHSRRTDCRISRLNLPENYRKLQFQPAPRQELMVRRTFKPNE